MREVYYAQLRTRRQRSGESLQEFEASIDRLIRLAYTEAPEDFRTSFAMQTFTAGVRENELQMCIRDSFNGFNKSPVYFTNYADHCN